MLLTIEFDDCEQLPSLMSVAVLVLYNHVSIKIGQFIHQCIKDCCSQSNGRKEERNK